MDRFQPDSQTKTDEPGKKRKKNIMTLYKSTEEKKIEMVYTEYSSLLIPLQTTFGVFILRHSYWTLT